MRRDQNNCDATGKNCADDEKIASARFSQKVKTATKQEKKDDKTKIGN